MSTWANRNMGKYAKTNTVFPRAHHERLTSEHFSDDETWHEAAIDLLATALICISITFVLVKIFNYFL